MKSFRKFLVAIAIILLSLGGVVTLAGIAFIGYFGYSIDQATKPVTDVSRYPEFVSPDAESASPLQAHFPRSIPSHAKNVKLHFLPSFLQGGRILQLRMQLTAVLLAAETGLESVGFHR
ncbi:MAG: hypothetical protein AAFN08_07895, partial [Cyanobacteria bacterium J06559_3]